LSLSLTKVVLEITKVIHTKHPFLACSYRYFYGRLLRNVQKRESGGKEVTAALQVQVEEPGFRRRRVMFFAYYRIR
jgi:hypothetical protein